MDDKEYEKWLGPLTFLGMQSSLVTTKDKGHQTIAFSTVLATPKSLVTIDSKGYNTMALYVDIT